MAKKPEFTREEAIEFIKQRPEILAATKKPLDELSTQELTRKARTAKKAEAQGRAFSNKEARGHAGNVSGRAMPVRHIDPKAKEEHKHLLEQYVVGTPERPPDVQDLLRVVSKIDQVRKSKGIRSENFVLAVYGKLKQSGICEDITLNLKMSEAVLAQKYAQYADSNDLVAMINDLFGYETPEPRTCEGVGSGWIAIYSVSIRVKP